MLSNWAGHLSSNRHDFSGAPSNLPGVKLYPGVILYLLSILWFRWCSVHFCTVSLYCNIFPETDLAQHDTGRLDAACCDLALGRVLFAGTGRVTTVPLLGWLRWGSPLVDSTPSDTKVKVKLRILKQSCHCIWHHLPSIKQRVFFKWHQGDHRPVRWLQQASCTLWTRWVPWNVSWMAHHRGKQGEFRQGILLDDITWPFFPKKGGKAQGGWNMMLATFGNGISPIFAEFL